jgi:glycine cleavage system regulatory protein
MDQVDSFTERPVRSALSGCLYATFVVSVSVSLLLVNALLCLTIYGAIPKSGSEALTSRLGQLFFFVAPILLLLVQWNLLDRLQRLFNRQG